MASIGFAQDAKSEETGRYRNVEQDRKNAADPAVADSLAEQAEEPVEMVVGSPPMVSDDTGTPGNGNWEINVVVDGDVSKHCFRTRKTARRAVARAAGAL